MLNFTLCPNTSLSLHTIIYIAQGYLQWHPVDCHDEYLTPGCRKHNNLLRFLITMQAASDQNKITTCKKGFCSTENALSKKVKHSQLRGNCPRHITLLSPAQAHNKWGIFAQRHLSYSLKKIKSLFRYCYHMDKTLYCVEICVEIGAMTTANVLSNGKVRRTHVAAMLHYQSGSVLL